MEDTISQILQKRNGLFTLDFAGKELDRRYACAAKYQREARARRAVEHRELMNSAIKKRTQDCALPYRLRKYYSTQFMTEEWLTHPQYIDSEHWLLTPRPLGRRCLLISSQGLTISITRQGDLLHSFESGLPNGSPETGIREPYTVFDSVYNEEDRMYYVLDVLSWNGVAYHEHPAEFRLLLARQYVKELVPTKTGPNLTSAPVYLCSPESIRTVYTTEYPFRKDGFLFYRDTGEYVLGVSPEMLLWKDALSSPYPVDEGQEQHMTLHLSKDGRLMTLDKVPLLTLSPDDRNRLNLRSGALVTLAISGIDTSIAIPNVQNPRILRAGNGKKMKADQWSRILFQYMAREGLIDFEDLVRAAGKDVSEEWDVQAVLYKSITRDGKIGDGRHCPGPSDLMDIDTA